MVSLRRASTLPLLSVIIPAYNAEMYIAQALHSVFNQTYKNLEVLVVDDGSTDATCEVVARFADITYVHQENRGLSSARNTGINVATGEFIAFLDADDRFLPGGLQAGLDCFARYPMAKLVSGHYQFMSHDGEVLPIWREMHVGTDREFTTGDFHILNKEDKLQGIKRRKRIVTDHYTAFLRTNYIGMHAAVLYRRDVFDSVGGFDESLPACEDYEMYLRIARQHPVACHDAVVAQYRRHAGGMSSNTSRMLAMVLRVLEWQLPYIQDDEEKLKAYRTGVRFWYLFYCKQFIKDIPQHIRRGDLRSVVYSAFGPIAHLPPLIAVVKQELRSRISQVATGTL